MTRSRNGWRAWLVVTVVALSCGCGDSSSDPGATPSVDGGAGSGGATGGTSGAAGKAGAATGGSGGTAGGAGSAGAAGAAAGGSGGTTGGPALCRNGTQDQGETGVDCGGPCPNADCCANGYLDDAETGVDCGGSCGACTASTYFVSNDGDDANTGTAPTSAWKSLGKVNQSTFQPGDSILLHRGGEWREELIIKSSGAPGSSITFGTYGQGGKPRILGSSQAAGWTQVAGHPNVWRSSGALEIPNVGKASSIFFGEQNGTTTWGRVQATDATPECGSGYSLMVQEYDWCWDNDAIVVYSSADPGSRYKFVEVPQRRSAISMESHAPAQHIRIDGLELKYTTMYGYNDGWPMDYEVRGLVIQNCHIGYVGIQGGSAAMGMQIWHSDMIVRNNEIHDSGRRNVSYNVYLDNGRTKHNLVFENVLFEDNVLYNGFHTTGFDISCEPGSGGDTFGDTFSGFTIRNNFVWDDPTTDPQAAPNDFTSMGIYLWGESAVFTGFQLYNNVVKNTKQKLLVLYNVTNTAVFNNTFYGMNPHAGVLGTSTGYRGMVTVAGDVQSLSFDNNILYGNVSSDHFHLQCVAFSGTSQSGVSSMNHNLFFHEYADQPIVSTQSSSYDMSEWNEYRQSGLGFDQDSPTPANPLFVDAANDDFRLQPGSPAINAGAAMTGRTSDFHGDPIVGVPDIGAVEYQP